MALEVTSVFEACRANARRQTEIGVVGDRDRLVVLFDLDHRSHRTKDFLSRNPHAVVNLGEQRRLQIEAGIVAVENLAAPVELRALLLAEGDIAKVLIGASLIRTFAISPSARRRARSSTGAARFSTATIPASICSRRCSPRLTTACGLRERKSLVQWPR